MNILIAGGTGLLGSHLSGMLTEKGHQVHILSRSKKANTIQWNPSRKQINREEIKDTEVVINLCGAGIADKRWTSNRKKELLTSRVEPTEFLLELIPDMPKLAHYVAASGITTYGFKSKETPYIEEDAYGTDFTSQLVKKWESASNRFQEYCDVTILRIAVVFSSKGGAVSKMTDPVKKGFGAAIASGKQRMQWIHINDLSRFVLFILENHLTGTYNTMAGENSNAEVMKEISSCLGKKMWLPNVPAVTMKLLYGGMADILIKGVPISNKKMLDAGFVPEYTELSPALNSLDLKSSL